MMPIRCIEISATFKPRYQIELFMSFTSDCNCVCVCVCVCLCVCVYVCVCDNIRYTCTEWG